MYLIPKAACRPVLTGLRFSVSLIIWLLRLKLRLEPPTNMIRGESVFFINASFCLEANSMFFAERGVAGKKDPTRKNNKIGEINMANWRMNLYILNS